MSSIYNTQNDLLLNNLLDFYNKDNNMERMIKIINGESRTSLRIIGWFSTNYAKKYILFIKWREQISVLKYITITN